MRIITSITFAALLSATTVPALADQFEWGPLTTKTKKRSEHHLGRALQ